MAPGSLRYSKSSHPSTLLLSLSVQRYGSAVWSFLAPHQCGRDRQPEPVLMTTSRDFFLWACDHDHDWKPPHSNCNKNNNSIALIVVIITIIIIMTASPPPHCNS
ncbi:hypothetical protein INS49_003508 [Diaporthe citri]|uniref:uncharacterized protein n=1 Tax=Diaporthe citri TaxID=83186 RepID=UPI001C821ADF|nr:uncharacterized protein INS49_003508 [Diaporthe citri]KAG6355546.1 hypothetical protein INS49_003508 [Diaporthe citri]